MRRTAYDIERFAALVRHELGVKPHERLSMQPVLEFALDDMIEGAYFQVRNDVELGGAEGVTDWHQPVITLSAGTYAKLQKAEPRARMTAAHELGHLLMHTQRPVFHYRTMSNDRRVDPEWQADQFAAALLMPASAFRAMRSVRKAMVAFGVSRGAAIRRARDLGIEIVDDLTRHSSAKKKGHGMRRTP